MLSCQKATQLISLEQDRTLSTSERLQLTVHRAICGHCRKFGRDLRRLRQAMRTLPEHLPDQDA